MCCLLNSLNSVCPCRLRYRRIYRSFRSPHVAISHTRRVPHSCLCHPRTTNCGEGKRPKYGVHWLFTWFGHRLMTTPLKLAQVLGGLAVVAERWRSCSATSSSHQGSKHTRHAAALPAPAMRRLAPRVPVGSHYSHPPTHPPTHPPCSARSSLTFGMLCCQAFANQSTPTRPRPRSRCSTARR